MIDPSTIERFRQRREEIESSLASPEILSAPGRLKVARSEYRRLGTILTLSDRITRLRQQMEECQTLLRDDAVDPEMRALADAEFQSLAPQLPDAEKELLLELLPPDPADDRNTIVEIRAGTGGEEAALFAGVLARMYKYYAERRGWKISTLDANPSDLGGFKEIIFSVEGDRVFRDLRYESGVQRVQRVPETEAQGRIHTSAATVAVLPEAEEVDHIDIPPEEI
ncbi:MAG: PCRF domain-containing protein, partial [Kiritimatiellia bacterium]|nr:PCRF domain-containing protein [Kiritimatiellia bacterium]